MDLMPTLNKMSRYQFLFILLEGTNHEQPSRNNQYTCCPLPRVRGGIFSKKKAFHGVTNLFGQIYRGLIYMGVQMIRFMSSGK